MSMKQELETWVSALERYDHNDFEKSLEIFQPIADTSKILFNCGVIRATLGEHEEAVKYYTRAIALDQYLAIAYFQAGVSNFLLGGFEEALANFNDTLLYLRGNNHIDYEQLGLKYKLHSCEALFNRGLCYVYLQAVDTGLQDMIHATREKASDDHNVIDEAIKDRAEGYTVFSIPVGTVFRPSDAKVKNVRARDYLGKTQVRLVASEQQQQPPSQHKRNVSADTWSRSDRAPHELSYAATNLVRPGLVSRSRQQSEPPINRNLFPPTPPPENEKPAPLSHKKERPQKQQPTLNTDNVARVSPNSASQTRSAPPVDAPRPPRSHSATRARPGNLDLGAAAFEQPLMQKPSSKSQDTQRRGAARSASERPAERRRDYEYDRERLRCKPSRERLFGAVEEDEGAAEAGARLVREQSSQSEHRRNRQSFGRVQGGRRREHDIVEEEEEDEVIDNGPGVRMSGTSMASGRSAQTYQSGQSSVVGGLKSWRVKVHYPEETRYIILQPALTFHEFADQIVKKFGGSMTGRGMKIKTKDDEDDLITLGDQDDLDPCLQTARRKARAEGTEVGKLEVWVQIDQIDAI